MGFVKARLDYVSSGASPLAVMYARIVRIVPPASSCSHGQKRGACSSNKFQLEYASAAALITWGYPFAFHYFCLLNATTLNVIKKENEELLADSNSILNRWKDYTLNVHKDNDTGEYEMQTAEPLISYPTLLEDKIVIEELKSTLPKLSTKY